MMVMNVVTATTIMLMFFHLRTSEFSSLPGGGFTRFAGKALG